MLMTFDKNKSPKHSIGGVWTKSIKDINRATLIREVLDKKTNLDVETKNSYNTLSQLQETKDLIMKEMNILKENELARMCKEFLLNDYARRFEVDLKQVFSALVGENEALTEVSRLKYEQKV